MSGVPSRYRIGIVFTFNKNWLGGVYYIINLINALKFLDDADQPELIVFYSDELQEHATSIDYPHLTLINVKTRSIFRGYIQSWLTQRNVWIDDLLKKHRLDAIYPLNDQPISSSRYPIAVAAWFPDLQHKFYPEFFSKKQWWLREIRLRILLSNTAMLVVSSEDVASHFRQFYRLRPELTLSTLRFASVIDEKALLSREVIDNYKLPSEYFIVSNQFHNHKNHQVVFKAVALLKAKGVIVHLAVTGRFENKGNEKYIEDLKRIIHENKLEGQIHLLGVIPREHQLTLMKYAKAVIQPSFFEGWSTVIEDAKTLQVSVVASDLPVHYEQLGDRGIYFSPKNSEQLAEILQATVWPGGVLYEPAQKRYREFASQFLRLFQRA